jgi:hypothetical protein
MRPHIQAEFDLIIDTITCADGGLNFMRLRNFLDEFDRRAASGDKDAEGVILIMRRFANIVKLTQEES